ncbi:hypothetical protein LJK88_26405 [Paenibacillus sp. P26]|nr:hypothetical protein LJK88_26405 [Paenibacillus sp. P26]UUZ95079.1 hypothetical protein LJK87_11565 [Paenibacillus sp. P25]
MTKHSIDNLIDSFTVYLEVNKNYAKGTVEIYNYTIVRLASWLKEAATTRARIVSAIKQFFKWAIKQQYLQYDVSQYIENPKLGEWLPKVFHYKMQ